MATDFMINNNQYSDALRKILHSDLWSMQALTAVRSLKLPDWAIGAGVVRSLVWDHLSCLGKTEPDDVDVLFFDQNNLSKEYEMEIEQSLRDISPDVPWSVKNQARMHLRNKDLPYQDTKDAMCYWLETATAIAIRFEDNDDLTILAPFGLKDLFNMIIRPTPAARSKMDQFENRTRQKDWLNIWPELIIDKMENRGSTRPIK